VLIAGVVSAGCFAGQRSIQQTTAPSFGGARPVGLHVPASYDPARSWPLLVVLHGYGATASGELAYLQIQPLVNEAGILLAAPEGTREASARANQFWNATDACCDHYGSSVDDVAYLSGLIDEIAASYNVDPKRIYLLGHSNGGFMAYRMACDRAQKIAAIVSLAGATWLDAARCAPSRAVSVLEIHGDQDRTISYDGGAIAGTTYPGAMRTVTIWASYSGCASGRIGGPAIDVDTRLRDKETTTQRFEGCPVTIDVELWTIAGGGHIPAVGPGFRREVWTWLSAHAAP